MDKESLQDVKKAQQIHRAQVAILYAYIPNIIVASMIGALILATVQWSVISHTTLLLWLAYMSFFFMLRAFTYYKYKHTYIDLENTPLWEKNYILSAIPTFLGWGAAGTLLFPVADPLHQSVTFLTIFGIAAGGTNSLAARRLPIFIFLPIVLIPISIMTFLEDNNVSPMLAPLILIYAVFLSNVAKKHYQSHLENITLRIESKQRENQMRIAEKKVRINEARLANAESIAHLGNWEWDITTGDMYWSQEIFRIFNLGANEVSPSFELFITQIHPDERDFINQALQSAIKHQQSFNHTFRIKTKGNTCATLKCLANPMQGRDGKVVRMTGIIQNVSEQVMLEEQLLQAQKMEAIGTLVGGIAHDFNNMLGNLLGQTYLAKKEVLGNTKLLGRIVNIEKTSNRAAKIVEQLLVFARKDGVQHQTLDFTQFMHDTAPLNQAGISERINIEYNIEQNLIYIEGDNTQLQQVLLNLLNNAAHALKEQKEPQITISLEHFEATTLFQQEHPEITNKHLAHLSVTDNGHGINKENIPHIFDPFYTTKEAGQGTGLGLSMVYGAIQSHHGITCVDSVEGQGTTIHIYLPISQTSGDILNQSSSLQNLASFAEHGETILLVDDEDILRDSIQEALESLGYKIIAADNGVQAVQFFKEHQQMISLVISDIVMPKMSGYEAAQQIRDINAAVPFIFMSGYNPEQFSERSALENSLLLKKPTTIDKLHQHIRNFLD